MWKQIAPKCRHAGDVRKWVCECVSLLSDMLYLQLVFLPNKSVLWVCHSALAFRDESWNTTIRQQHPVKWFLIYICFLILLPLWDDWFRNGITPSPHVTLMSVGWYVTMQASVGLYERAVQYKLSNGSLTPNPTSGSARAQWISGISTPSEGYEEIKPFVHPMGVPLQSLSPHH